MTISEAQLRTLRLLNQQAAHRVYRSQRAGDYTWTHENSRIALTPTLHRLFSSGYATVSRDNRDVAVITQKGRAVVAARGSVQKASPAAVCLNGRGLPVTILDPITGNRITIDTSSRPRCCRP